MQKMDQIKSTKERCFYAKGIMTSEDDFMDLCDLNGGHACEKSGCVEFWSGNNPEKNFSCWDCSWKGKAEDLRQGYIPRLSGMETFYFCPQCGSSNTMPDTAVDRAFERDALESWKDNVFRQEHSYLPG